VSAENRFCHAERKRSISDFQELKAQILRRRLRMIFLHNLSFGGTHFEIYHGTNMKLNGFTRPEEWLTEAGEPAIV
jgi:hypothetical protein